MFPACEISRRASPDLLRGGQRPAERPASPALRRAGRPGRRRSAAGEAGAACARAHARQHRHGCRGDQPIGRPGEERNRRVEQQEAGGVAGLRASRAAPVGRPPSASPSSATDCGGSSTPSFAATKPTSATYSFRCSASVVGRRTGGGLAGSCRPRRRGPSAAGAGRSPGRPGHQGRSPARCRGPSGHGRRRVRRRRRIRTWWRQGTGWSVGGGPTGHRGSRSARRPRPSPADEGTARRAHGAHRRTSRRRRGRCGSPHLRGTIVGPVL